MAIFRARTNGDGGSAATKDVAARSERTRARARDDGARVRERERGRHVVARGVRVTGELRLDLSFSRETTERHGKRSFFFCTFSEAVPTIIGQLKGDTVRVRSSVETDRWVKYVCTHL
jgi:hypothetical protein